MAKREKIDPCEYCEGQVKLGQVTVDLRRGDALVVIGHVPAEVCARCGYKYFSPDVVDKLQHIFAKRIKARKKVKVPVLEFNEVA